MACLFVSCSVLSKVGKSIGIVKEKEVSEKVESTKKDIKKAQQAVEIDDVDEAVNFLKKFSK